MSARVDVVVAGGGANGLVAAARLARAGKSVVVLESGDAIGGQGRGVTFAPGFQAFPLAADPGWVPPRVAASLGLSPIETLAADTPLSVAVPGGDALVLSRDPARAAAEIAKRSKVDAAKWPEFVARLRALAGFLEVLYQTPAPDVDASSLGEWLPMLALGRKFRSLGKRDMIEFLRTLPMSVQELADDWFQSADLKAAIATGGIQDLRQGPRSGGTGFVLLHHLVGAPLGAVRGRTPWRSGPAAFTEAAEKAARAAGATIRTGAAVARIIVKDDAVTGVVLASGEELAADAVLSTADPATTLLDQVDPVWLDPEFVRDVGNVRHRGCTAFVLYALDALPAIAGLSAEALGGTVSLTGDLVALEKAADAAKYGTIAGRPHVELHAPTVHWPSLAPAGKHVLVARVHYVPYDLRDGAWDAGRAEALAGAATRAIEASEPGFGSRILHRTVLTPHDLEERFGLREGAATQGEMALDQILFMRPVAGWGRHAMPLAGLYLGGAGTHPGPGILGGAGWLAAERLLANRRKGR